jgi:pimeloyl-ACP methyl ester carboxylesterase
MMRLIDEVIKEPPVVFGHSFGGIVATMIAGMYPEKTRALIIGDIPGNSNHSIREFYKRTSSNWVTMREQIRRGEYARDWTFRYKNVDPEVLTPWATCGEDDESYNHFLNGYDTDVLFPKIACPVLLLRGNPELGSFMSGFDVSHAKNLIQDFTYIMVENVGHGLFLENIESVIMAITPFILSLL